VLIVKESALNSRHQNNRKPCAVVIGLDHINGIQTARILARHGIPVIAIASDPDHHCCRTKVCERILYADKTSEEFIETLEKLGPTLDQKAVLFPCEDTSVLLVSRNRHRLQQWFHVVLPEPDVVEMLMDKVRLYKYAQENGFPIPATHFVGSRESAVRAASELTYPLAVKPPNSAVPGWEENSQVKAYKVTSSDEFLALYDRIGSWAEQLIVQEWVEGTDANLFSCNCYLNDRSEPVATFVARKLRQWPPIAGDSCLGVECRDNVVLHESVRLLQSAAHRGLGYVEIKQDIRTGDYFILEPNIGRPTGRSAIAEAGGVELLYTMYCDAVGLPLPEGLEQSYGDAKWISLRKDLQSAIYHWREGDLTLKQWWRSVRGKKAYALFSWSDPGPFLGDLGRTFRLLLNAEERRKRDYRNI
jgi:predicted ATP-grasp superfamily ATP-dependent carboligase